MKHFAVWSCLTVSLALSGLARAQAPPAMLEPPAMEQPPVTQPPAPDRTRPTLQQRARPKEKSPDTAFQLSLTGTALGAGLLIAGASKQSRPVTIAGVMVAVFGPSLGSFYAGESRRGTMQANLRALAAGITVLAYSGLLQAAECFPVFPGQPECKRRPSSGLLVVGLGLGAASTFYSLSDAPRAARRHNARARQLVIAPAPIAGPGQTTGLGLQLGGRF